ncbi:MAG TPA: helix-turn-helix domain-containing protein [Pseudonocardiaceae bacterium]
MSAANDVVSGPAQVSARVGVSRLRILEILRRAPAGLGVREIAEQAGLHANTVRFHLDRLVTDGVVARHTEGRTGPGRPPLTFTMGAGPAAHGQKRSYRLLAEILAGFIAGAMPAAAAAAAQAGRTWGRYLAERPAPYRRTGHEEALTQLLRILDDIGFAPEFATPGGRREIRLRHRPFIEVAAEHREAVCSVHLGLMQGGPAEMRAPLTANRLEPLVQPSLCVAGLTETGPARRNLNDPLEPG